MNITELARKLGRTAQELKDILPGLGFDIGQRAIKVDDRLANKIIDEQKPLMDNDTYFYTKLAKEKYLKWARVNLTMWENVLEALEDSDINEMLKSAKDLGVL